MCWRGSVQLRGNLGRRDPVIVVKKYSEVSMSAASLDFALGQQVQHPDLGPGVVTAQYHFTRSGTFQPYIGIGPAFLLVVGTNDGALSNVRLANAVGLNALVGVDVMFNERWGMFLELNDIMIRSVATGNLGPAPVRANVRLDPLVFHTGLTYRF